jgi:hypothetical protein
VRESWVELRIQTHRTVSAASRGRCIGHERGNLARRKTIAHRLGFRSTTRMVSNKLTDSPSRLDIAMRLGLRPAMRAS